jgi:hypothetical protein
MGALRLDDLVLALGKTLIFMNGVMGMELSLMEYCCWLWHLLPLLRRIFSVQASFGHGA